MQCATFISCGSCYTCRYFRCYCIDDYLCTNFVIVMSFSEHILRSMTRCDHSLLKRKRKKCKPCKIWDGPIYTAYIYKEKGQGNKRSVTVIRSHSEGCKPTLHCTCHVSDANYYELYYLQTTTLYVQSMHTLTHTKHS
jgi:hypothetical protein